jgi:hypothetical protein
MAGVAVLHGAMGLWHPGPTDVDSPYGQITWQYLLKASGVEQTVYAK